MAMNYEIEIWQYHARIDNYKSNDIEEILKWFKLKWKNSCESGYAAFYVYKNSVELSFEELDRLGFI